MTAEELLERALAAADPRVRGRGWEVFASGLILRATRTGERYRLRIQGSERWPYRVDLDLTRGEWTCTCPYEHGMVCKHVLAALHGLIETPDIVTVQPSRRPRRFKLDGLSEDDVLNLLAQLEQRYPALMSEYALTAAHNFEEAVEGD